MANLTSTLTVALTDGVSGPAGKAAGSLKALGASGKDLERLAGASPELARLAKQLEELKKAAGALGTFREASKALDAAGTAMRRDRQELSRLSTELDRARKASEALAGVRSSKANPTAKADRMAAAAEVRKLERDVRAAAATVAESRSAFVAQGRAVRDLRSSLVGAGIPIDTLRSKEVSLKTAIEQTTSAMTRRGRVEEVVGRRRAAAAADADRQDRQISRAREARALRQGYSAERAQARADVLAAREARQVARFREARALREQHDEERVTAAAGARQVRREAAGALASMGGIALGHKVDAGTHAVGHTYREFDRYARQTEAFGNFTKAEMAAIVAMAIHGGASTRYNDIQWLQGAKALGGRGVKAGSVMSILPEAAQYGQAMTTSLPEAVTALEGSLFAFQRDLSTAEKAREAARRTADIQVSAAKSFGLTHEDLKGGYEYGALGASMTGLSEEKLLAFLGLGKKLNIAGDAQGNAWRAMTSKFLSPTRKGREALASVGIDYSKYQKMPDSLSVDNFDSMVSQQYGVKLDANAKKKLAAAFTNKDVFGNASAFAVAVADALQGQVGINNAKDRNKVVGSAERFRQTNVEKVDVNALMDALMDKIRGGNLALANAIFGEKQGNRIMAALRDEDVWNKSVKKLEDTPDGKAAGVAEKMNAGFDGAVSRFEGAVKNLESRMGASLDAGGEGGFLTGLVNGAGKLVQSLSEMDSRVLAAGSSVAWLGGKAAEAAGTFGLAVAAIGLTKASVDLSGAAALLSASAGGGPGGKLLTGGALATAGGIAAGGVIAGGVVAGAALGIAAAIDQAPKIIAEKGLGALDPATGGALDVSPMEGFGPKPGEEGALRRWWADRMPTWLGGAVAAAAASPSPAPSADPLAGLSRVGSAGASFGVTGPVEALGTKADETKDKLKAISDTTVAPKADASALDTILGKINEILSGLSQIPGRADAAAAAVGRASSVGGGDTGRVRAGLRDNHSAG